MKLKSVILAVTGLAVVVAGSIYLLGYGNRPPPFVASDLVVPPRNDSILSTTVHVDLAWLNSEIRQSIPNPLAEESKQRVATAVNVSGKLQVTQLIDKAFDEKVERKACSNFAKYTGICLAYKTLRETRRVTRKVEERVLKEVSRVVDVDATVDYTIWPTSTAVSVKGSQIAAVLEAEFKVRLNAELGGDAGDLLDLHITGLTSCGHGEAPAKLRATVIGDIGVAPSGTALTFASKSWRLDWLRDCELTAAKIDLEDLLRLPGIKKAFEKSIDEALQDVSGDHSVETALNAAWADISAPIRVSTRPEMWLNIHPQSMYVTNLRGNGKDILLDLSLRSRPAIVVGAMPAPSKEPFVSAPIDGEKGAIFYVETTLTYAQAGQILGQELAKHPIEKVGLRDVWVASDGRKLYIGARVTKPFRGHVQLFGTPQWREQGGAVSLNLPDIDFVATGDNRFVNGLSVVARSAFLTKLKDAAVFPLTEARAKAILAATEKPLNFKGKTEGSVTLTNTTITPEQIILERDRMRVPLLVATDLQVTVGRDRLEDVTKSHLPPLQCRAQLDPTDCVSSLRRSAIASTK